MTTTDSDLGLVKDFCESWAGGDLEHVLSFLAEDAEWENVPTGSIHGKSAIREKLGSVFKAADKIEWHLLHAASLESGHVLTERVDLVVVNGRVAKLRLMGIFHVTEGKIRLWRDYFDMETYRKALGQPAW